MDPSQCQGHYATLAEDSAVDVIYAATPHVLQCEHRVLCLEQGKAVLCEKPFAINSHQAREMIGTARQNGSVPNGGSMVKVPPAVRCLRGMIDRGEIGKLRYVRADFGFAPAPGAPSRLFDPPLGGGLLLDIGIYPVFLAVTLLERPDDVLAWMTPLPTGVESSAQ